MNKKVIVFVFAIFVVIACSVFVVNAGENEPSGDQSKTTVNNEKIEPIMINLNTCLKSLTELKTQGIDKIDIVNFLKILGTTSNNQQLFNSYINSLEIDKKLKEEMEIDINILILGINSIKARTSSEEIEIGKIFEIFQKTLANNHDISKNDFPNNNNPIPKTNNKMENNNTGDKKENDTTKKNLNYSETIKTMYGIDISKMIKLDKYSTVYNELAKNGKINLKDCIASLYKLSDTTTTDEKINKCLNYLKLICGEEITEIDIDIINDSIDEFKENGSTEVNMETFFKKVWDKYNKVNNTDLDKKTKNNETNEENNVNDVDNSSEKNDTLPETGENSNLIFICIGLLLMFIGLMLYYKKKQHIYN